MFLFLFTSKIGSPFPLAESSTLRTLGFVQKVSTGERLSKVVLDVCLERPNNPRFLPKLEPGKFPPLELALDADTIFPPDGAPVPQDY